MGDTWSSLFSGRVTPGEVSCALPPDCVEVPGGLPAGAASSPSLSTHFPVRKVGSPVAAPIAHPLQVS